MIVHGREIRFKRTVLAACKLAEICPDKNLNNIGKLMDNVETLDQETFMSFFVVCLNEGYEESMVFENPDYQANPLTMDELMHVDTAELQLLFAEAVDVFRGDVQTVEVEPQKQKRGNRKKKAVTSD